ncbi:MAG: sulfonate ABC transporter [bacterium]|jgi:DNA-directed RNA polymerase subunit RPC12/RpoP|nr:sulfonate ABC transporter [Bacillota bacterium]
MVLCPVCNLEFEIPAGTGPGDTVECPYCGVELVLKLEGDELVAEEV